MAAVEQGQPLPALLPGVVGERAQALEAGVVARTDMLHGA